VCAGMMGVLQLCIRTADLVVTFAIGPLTDACVSPCGKRKPFIMFGVPCLMVAWFMLSHPPSLSSLGKVATDQSRFGPHEFSNNCSKLKLFVERVVASGQSEVLLGDRKDMRSAASAKDFGWLAFSNTLFAIGGLTSTVIPYDALGNRFSSQGDLMF